MSGEVHIWTDGSAWEGRGGFAALVVRRRYVHILSGPIGPDRDTGVTNQVAELFAIMAGLSMTKPLPGGGKRRVTVYSDSAYAINGFRLGWVEHWKANGWLNSSKKPVANRALWETIALWAEFHEMTWQHMRGHGRGNEDPRWVAYNARADRLASAGRSERYSVNRRIERT